MAVRTSEEIIKDLEFLNDGDTKELYVKLLEDITDSVNGDSVRIGELESALEDQKKLVEEYREKYISRFKNGKKEEEEVEEEKEEEEVEEEKEVTIEDVEEVWKDERK